MRRDRTPRVWPRRLAMLLLLAPILAFGVSILVAGFKGEPGLGDPLRALLFVAWSSPLMLVGVGWLGYLTLGRRKQ